MSAGWTRKLCATVLILCGISIAFPAYGQGDPQTLFERAYFLHTHEHDFAAAAHCYQSVLDSADVVDALRIETVRRLAECKEELAAADLARLMPANSLAYVEVRRPGEHVARVLKMLGLASAKEQSSEPQSTGMPLGGGLYLPDDFAVSPAIIEELGKFRGVAVALTSIEPDGRPSGVAVLHPGDVNLLRGKIETLVQFLQPDSPVEGFKTYQVQGEAWITLTSRLVIVSDSREGVSGAVSRLKDSGSTCLATSESFRSCQPARDQALLFAYVNGPAAVAELDSKLAGPEAAIVRRVLDLDHLQAFTLAAGASEDSLQFEVSMHLDPEHNNLAYGLIRTEPLSRRSLEYVPSGVAAVGLLGLNPSVDPGAVSGSDFPGLTVMSLGREVFGNIEELALFVAKPDSGDSTAFPIPDLGLVLASNNAAESEIIWNQLLSLPAMFGPRGFPAPRDVSIEGTDAKVYSFQGPSVAVARLSDHVLVTGTESAVAAAIRAKAAGKSIINDAEFEPLLARMDPTTSKAILIDVPRVIEAAGRFDPSGRHADEATMAAAVLQGFKAVALTEEGACHFSVRVEATGLPDVPKLVNTLMTYNRERLASARTIADRGRDEAVRRAAGKPAERE